MVEKRKLRVLPIVKAYPEPSERYGTTVCVAGVTVPEGLWIRLYPIRFMQLNENQRFKKYQIIDVVATKSERDSRPESYRVDEESIRVIGQPISTGGEWSERKRRLRLAPVVSLCELQRLQKADRTSLGMIRVREVTKFCTVEANKAKFQRADDKYEYAATADLFNENKLRVEALPFKYQYWFRCTDGACRGHKSSIIDWEAYELHRRMIKRWGESKAFEKVRQKYVDDICGPGKDTHFFMGNMQQHPGSFLVLGTFYPPVSDSMSLFELGEGRGLRPGYEPPVQVQEEQPPTLDFD